MADPSRRRHPAIRPLRGSALALPLGRATSTAASPDLAAAVIEAMAQLS